MSGLPFELFLALRYLRPKRTFVSIITVISVVGVMLGVSVLIIVISVMTGFDRQLRERILGFSAHLRIEHEAPIADYAPLMKLVGANPHVKGVAPYVVSQILLESQPEHGAARALAPIVRGVDPRLEATVSDLPSKVIAGEFDVRGRGLVVGKSIAGQLGLRVGDRVAVYSIHDFQEWRASKEKGREEAPLADDYEVRGVFDAGYFQFNNLFVISSLANAQDLSGLDDSVQALSVMLDDANQADAVKRQLQVTLGGSAYISTWWEDNEAMLAVLVEKNVMLYILFFIVLVAAFGITCTLITFVVLKTREIGLMKAMGASNRQVMWVFLGQSLIVSVLGVVAGLGFGFLAVAYRNEFLGLMRKLTGFELFPASIYGFTELPALIMPGDIAIICGGSLVICLLAAAFPAWHASRLNPVEALRHE